MSSIDPVTTRIPVNQGTPADLTIHLQAVCNLELWTIPLYLTALSSIREDRSSIPMPPRVPDRYTSSVSRLIVSVAVQEMYHLQLAGNLSMMFGAAPRLDWPVYQGRIPYVSTLPDGVTVALGPANDATLRLMVAVETPDRIDSPVDPGTPDVPAFPSIQYDANHEPCYPSIGTLYSVVEQLANRFKRSELRSGAHQVANGLFSAWFPRTGVLNESTFDDAIDVIVDQGEGALGRQDAPLDDREAVPNQRGYRDPFFYENHFSHCERFSLALANGGKGLVLWPSNPPGPTPQQAHLSVIFAELLSNLRAAWAGGRPDLGPMFLMRSALAQVFADGQLPALAPPAPGAPSYAESAASVAPPEGATWDRNVRYYFTQTEIAAMQANHVQSPDLGNQGSVLANQAAISALVSQAQMPPGELNAWSPEQVNSFGAWKGQ